MRKKSIAMTFLFAAATCRYLSLRQLAATVSRVKPIGEEAGPKVYLPNMNLLHTALMRVKFEEIQSRNCWHMARLLRRTTFSTLTSEAIAESAGSVLRYVERKHGCGKNLALPALLDAVTLRMHGATGAVSTIPFLRAAVAEHFGKGAHFFLDARYRARKAQSERAKDLLGPSSSTRTIRVPCLLSQLLDSQIEVKRVIVCQGSNPKRGVHVAVASPASQPTQI